MQEIASPRPLDRASSAANLPSRFATLNSLPSSKPQQDFSGYREFTSELQMLAVASKIDGEKAERVEACLDGTAGAELRRLVGVETRRAQGVFFTGSKLAKKLVGSVTFNPLKHFVYDPAVGAGDLLLAVARRLPRARNLRSTLKAWGGCLAGTDIQPEFVEAAKFRLALLARQLHGGIEKLPQGWRKLFPFIRVGDGLRQRNLYARATHIVMNPPFSSSEPAGDCDWKGGRIPDAAMFVIRALERAEPGTLLTAVLPDVLRSGSFQHQWRERVSDLAEVWSVKHHGIFDDFADVDVFRLDLLRRAGTDANLRRWPKPRVRAKGTIGDYFDVHVGRVVPHRDDEAGPLRRYIHPRNIPVWQEVTRISEKRQHEGLAYQPPFVVLRRTSRPGHPYRAAATVILGKAPVAVENHLIVCEPHDRSANTCRSLMKQLHTQRVNAFLNQRIRCRHLTVGSVAAIPFTA